MLVSIITPCYNSAKFIANTIVSVIAQTYENWEMLIVDDCSTDNSAEIIQSYSAIDNRIKYFKTESPSGSPTRPRNLGIEKAKGRYIAFLDSDDLWLPNKLEKQISLLRDNPRVAIAYSYYEKIDEEGNRDSRIIKSPAEVSYSQLLYGNVIGCLTGVYDTSKVGKVFMEYVGHEDYVMWLAILKKGFVAKNTNDVQALYRVREGSVSANKFKVLKWQWNIYTNIEQVGFIRSCCYFCCYALKAFMKALK